MILKVNSVEEDILAPKYGLKGKVDASVLVNASTAKTQQCAQISCSSVCAHADVQSQPER